MRRNGIDGRNAKEIRKIMTLGIRANRKYLHENKALNSMFIIICQQIAGFKVTGR